LSFKTYAAAAIPLALDIVILVLTALKTYHFACESIWIHDCKQPPLLLVPHRL